MVDFIKKYQKSLLFILLPLLSLAMHWSAFQVDFVGPHVWRQTQTQSNIKAFVEEDMNLLNPRIPSRGDGDGIYRMELPLYQWMVAASAKVVGYSPQLSRVWSFLIGLLCLFGFYHLCKRLFRHPLAGIVGAWTLSFSPLFFYYTVNPMSDNLALALSVCGLALFTKWYQEKSVLALVIGALLIGIATAVKLPYLFTYAFPFAVLIHCWFKSEKHTKKNVLLAFFLGFVSLLPAAIWYAWVMPHWHGNGGVLEGVSGGVNWSNYWSILYFHTVSTLPELMANYAATGLLLVGFWRAIKIRKSKPVFWWALVLWLLGVVAYFLFELEVIAKVHDYYLMPFLPLVFLAIVGGAMWCFQQNKKWLSIAVVVMLLAMPVTAWLRVGKRWETASPGFNADIYAHRSAIQAVLPKGELVVAGNDVSTYIFLYYIDRHGWAFSENDLTEELLENYIERGARYLLSDSEKMDALVAQSPLVDSVLLQAGSVKVYALRSEE